MSLYWQALIPCSTQKRRPTSGRSSWGICCRHQWTVITDTPALWPRHPASRWWSGSSSPGLCICPTHRCVKSTHTCPDSYILRLHKVDRMLSHMLFFPSSPSPPSFPFPLIPPQLLCTWNHNCLYSGWVSRKGEPITGIWMIVWYNFYAYIMLLIWDSDYRVLNWILLQTDAGYHTIKADQVQQCSLIKMFVKLIFCCKGLT